MDSEDSSSHANAPSGEQPPSSAAMDSEDNSSHANAPSSEEPSSSAAMDSGYSLSVSSGDMIRIDDLVFDALSTIDDEHHDGTGRDFDGIFKFNKERNEFPEGLREVLRDEVKKLASQGKIEKVGNRYKMPHDVPATSATTEESSSVSVVPTASASEATTENIIDALAKQVAEAEDLELQAKEAHELADKHTQLLNLESHIILQLAVEILSRCNIHLLTDVLSITIILIFIVLTRLVLCSLQMVTRFSCGKSFDLLVWFIVDVFDDLFS